MKETIFPNDFRALKIAPIFLVILVFLTHCATKPEVISKEAEKEILRSRIGEYWQYQIDSKVESVYQYEVPEFREKTSLLEYANRFRLVQYLEANIVKIEIEGKEGKATVNVVYRMFLKHIAQKNLTQVKEENWIKVKNVWYHIPEGFKMEKIF